MKALELVVVIGVAVALSGCSTNRISEPEVVSTTTTETTVVTKVVETATVSASRISTPVAVPSPTVNTQVAADIPADHGVDILQGAKKPCGTVAADAPKFVTPEQE